MVVVSENLDLFLLLSRNLQEIFKILSFPSYREESIVQKWAQRGTLQKWWGSTALKDVATLHYKTAFFVSTKSPSFSEEIMRQP